MTQLSLLIVGLLAIWFLARWSKGDKVYMSKYWLHDLNNRGRDHSDNMRRWDWDSWNKKW